MRKVPKISVIIPVYKVEAYLRKCVDSVLGQTHKDLEVILVDDGSPDHCGAICDEYAAKDSRVKVIHKENGGVSAARNVGLDAATGDWIMFVDSDDLIDHHYAEFLLNAGLHTGADLICCGNDRFVEEPNLLADDQFEKYSMETFDREEAMENAFQIWYKPNVWGKLVHRELFEAIRFPDAKRAEDLWVSYRLLASCEKVTMMRHYTPYHYRNTQQSAMSKLTACYIEDDMKMRLDSFLTLFAGRYHTTEVKLARQTKRIFLDFALSVYASGDKECTKALKRCGRELYREMWKPMTMGFGEKMDYMVMNSNIKAWTFLQLVKHKLFKKPLYIE